MRPLNVLEKTAFLMDTGGKGNLNFASVSSYKGELNATILKEAIKHLQLMHPMLQVYVDTSQKEPQFAPASEPIPFQECASTGGDQWKECVRQDLAERFCKPHEPLLRVRLLRGEREGTLLITFSRVATDGTGALELTNEFYEIVAKLSQDKSPKKIKYGAFPDLKSLYPLCKSEISNDLPITPRKDVIHHTTFCKDVLDPSLTRNIVGWSKKQDVKVHGVLFAAFLSAFKKIAPSPNDEVTAVSSVNYRTRYRPSYSKKKLALLSSHISDTVRVKPNGSILTLAKTINYNVNTQLSRNEHIKKIQLQEQRLAKDLTPQEAWHRARLPNNAVILTNYGPLDFTGNYEDSELTLNELCLVENVEVYFEDKNNVILSVLNFRDRIILTLGYLEELLDENLAKAVLFEMKQILTTLK